MKKPVHSSHLALRFYKADGWTKEILDKYLERGRVVDIWPGQEQRDYWFLDHEKGSRLDMSLLLENEISEVVRWDEGRSGQSDIDFLKRMNW